QGFDIKLERGFGIKRHLQTRGIFATNALLIVGRITAASTWSYRFIITPRMPVLSCTGRGTIGARLASRATAPRILKVTRKRRCRLVDRVIQSRRIELARRAQIIVAFETVSVRN